MQRHATDEGVFIRSMATRGQFGGLSQATRGRRMVMDAMGKDCILIETVGVGQDEVDIARMADTTIIVLTPGLGDDIQAIKAGILEVGDLFVINKADREGVEKTEQELRTMFELAQSLSAEPRDWRPPIIRTVAARSQGLEELCSAIESHRAFLAAGQSPYYVRLKKLKHKLELIDLVKQRVVDPSCGGWRKAGVWMITSRT
jgi:LAO/AO transport system kinase